MANFKHKVFLLIAKWIPVAVAAGILINNTLAMLDVKDVILDLFDITVGSSLAFVIMMYACSYVFNFCYWHKIVITYDLFVLLYILLNNLKLVKIYLHSNLIMLSRVRMQS